MVGVVVVGLAVALGVFIHLQLRDPGPREDVPRAVAIPALYATMGLLAIIGAVQRRPAIVVAAGMLCLVGTFLSAATIEFAVPGILLIGLASRIGELSGRRRAEPLIAAVAGLLVVGAAIALLGMTEGRCWLASGSPADPTYSVMSCGGQAGSVGVAQGGIAAGGQTFAGGYVSGVLTTGGGLVEAVLLLGALTLAAATGRTPISTGFQPSIDQVPPL
jgi:hypothetical protein